jgi:hypothetical protein
VEHIKKELMESASPTRNIVLEGHELHEEDICLMYTFDQATGGTVQFETYSDGQVFLFPKASLPRDGDRRKYLTHAFPDCVQNLCQDE